MIGFFIKKAFFDGWDNLIGLVVYNLISVGFLMLLLLSSYVMDVSTVLWCVAVMAVVFCFCLFQGALSNVCFGYSNYQRGGFASFREGFGRYLSHSVFYFVMVTAIIVIMFFVIPFYMALEGIIGTLLSVIMVWVAVFLLLAMPYYFALSSYLPGDGPLKTFKKCFIIMGDNIGFTLFFAVYNVILLILTVVTMGFIPGVAGMNLACHDAIKLMMLKYDYLEANPDTDRRHLPWDDILFDEREKVGPRSLRNMIFPWK